jgi:rhamnose utilization protein RhaD (predicted bifunctional aldolase and dehydrogenase)
MFGLEVNAAMVLFGPKPSGAHLLVLLSSTVWTDCLRSVRKPMNCLREIAELSHAFGVSDYVQAGGGNTSVKTDTTIWVKPSGTTLLAMSEADFLPMDRGKLAAMYDLKLPADVNEREARVAQVLQEAAAVVTDRRPSVETLLHDAFDARFVVHTHPAFVNGMTCAVDGAAACARIFPGDLWLEHADPGYTLFKRVLEALRVFRSAHGRQPEAVFLESHGLFVAGDTPGAVHETYARVMGALGRAYRDAGIETTLAVGPLPATETIDLTAASLRGVFGDSEAACLAAAGPFSVARGPLTPDHIVYARSYPYSGDLSAARLDAFRARHGYAPRVVSTQHGVFGVGDTQKTADLALLLARDGALVEQLANAFGGVRYMTDAARQFIENWEVEVYRRKVAAGHA